MCTVSWIHQSGGYHLLCNRDERHTRKTALPPVLHELGGVRLLAPVDADFGGSWIGVNEFGLSLCLLNRYRPGQIDAQAVYTSRGLLLMELLDSRSRSAVQERIEQTRLSRFQPFTLLALTREQPALVIEWTGRERLIENNGDAAMPLTSSSHDAMNVIASRKQLFNNMTSTANQIDSDLLYQFHASHWPGASAYSTCMHRDDAETVSFSWIKVIGGEIEFRYDPHSPCRAQSNDVAPPISLRLPMHNLTACAKTEPVKATA